MPPNTDAPSGPDRPAPPRRRARVSIKSFLVLTAVFGATAVSLGHLVRAAQGNQAEMGQFVIITAMLPTVVLVGASWFFKVLGRVIR